MALTDCLKVALDGKEISQADYDRLVNQHDRFLRKYGIASQTAAAANAKQELLDRLKAETAHKRRAAALTIATTRELIGNLRAHRNASGKADVAEAALFTLEHNGEAKFSSVEGRRGEVLGMAHAMMGSLLERFRRSKLLGDAKRKNRAQLPNVVRELFGEDTGDAAAKAYAETWTKTSEWLRQRFNAAGGAIGHLEQWGLPQRHDPVALRRRGLDAWRADIKKRLDVGRMQHPLTKTPIGAEELDDVLEDVWTSIVSDGWDEKLPQRRPDGKGALANQRAEHRFLVFKTADEWLGYQKDYGGGSDPFAAMMDHVSMMARDVAALEVLGPNPQATVEWLKQVVTKEGKLKAAGKPAQFAGAADRAGDRVRRYHNRIDAVYGSMRGWLGTPVNGRIAAIAGGVRNLITAGVLGSAAIASISDIGTSIITRRFAGVGGSVVRDYVRALTPAGRRDAVSAGLILDSAMHVFRQQARYVGTLDGSGITSYLADRVLTLSGLTPFTQAGKHAFGLGFFHEAANQAGKGFDQLDPLFRQKFEQYGIDAADWDKIRSAEIHRGESGLTLLRPAEVAGVEPRLAGKWLGMVQRETEYAVPTGGHRSRTLLLDQNQPGTIPGEVLRSFSQFKSFGAVFAMLHGARTHQLMMQNGKGMAMAYAGSVLLSAAFFGAIAMQLKSVAQGRDPQDMTKEAFWAGALLQGGGLGIYGDFFFADVNRYGGGLIETAAGATVSRLNDFRNLTLGNMIELARGQDTKFGRELVQAARGNVPGGNIWYLRLAWERGVLDQLQWMMDPNAKKSFASREQYWEKGTGQGFWWRPGELTPTRMPDFGAALGNPAEDTPAAEGE